MTTSIRAAVAGWATFCAMAIGALAIAPGAHAATISTYSFTQPYFVEAYPTLADITLTGSFSGTADVNGQFVQSALTDFSYTVTALLRNLPPITFSGGLSDLTFFAYTPESGAATLSIEALTGGNQLCVGFPAAVGLCGGTGYLGVFAPSGLSTFVATQGPDITLTAVTPIPPALPLFASALGALGLVGWRRRSRRLGAG